MTDKSFSKLRTKLRDLENDEPLLASHTSANKKLSYRRGTARRSMLVRSCSLSRDMAVRKVSISKSDLQNHSRVLAPVPRDRPHTFSY